jgi:hypothetical protein
MTVGDVPGMSVSSLMSERETHSHIVLHLFSFSASSAKDTVSAINIYFYFPALVTSMNVGQRLAPSISFHISSSRFAWDPHSSPYPMPDVLSEALSPTLKLCSPCKSHTRAKASEGLKALGVLGKGKRSY